MSQSHEHVAWNGKDPLPYWPDAELCKTLNCSRATHCLYCGTHLRNDPKRDKGWVAIRKGQRSTDWVDFPEPGWLNENLYAKV